MRLRLFLFAVLSIPLAIALTVTAAWFPRAFGIPQGVWTDACVAREFAERPWRFAAGGDSTIDLFKADGVPSMEFALESVERISKSTPNPRADATRPDWSSLEAACEEALEHLHEYPPGGHRPFGNTPRDGPCDAFTARSGRSGMARPTGRKPRAASFGSRRTTIPAARSPRA